MFWVISISRQWNKWGFPFPREVGSKHAPLFYSVVCRKSEWLIAAEKGNAHSAYISNVNDLPPHPSASCSFTHSPRSSWYLWYVCIREEERKKGQSLLDCSPPSPPNQMSKNNMYKNKGQIAVQPWPLFAHRHSMVTWWWTKESCSTAPRAHYDSHLCQVQKANPALTERLLVL